MPFGKDFGLSEMMIFRCGERDCEEAIYEESRGDDEPEEKQEVEIGKEDDFSKHP